MVDLTAYNAALEGAFFHQVSDPGYLRIGGGDRVDYLQRQTTNDVSQLVSSVAVVSVLTSPTTRILDVLTLLDEGEHIGILTLPGRGASTAGFLRSRIFFNDDVSLDDLSEDFDQIIIEGPRSANTLTVLGLTPLGVGAVSQGDVGGVPATVIGQSGVNEVAYRFLVPKVESPKLVSALMEAGAPHIDEDLYQVLRVEAGMAGARGELTENYTPLEVGLQEIAVSLTKGCYTGQEVIARQVNYDKVTRGLVGLQLAAPVDAGAQVRADGRPVGQVTSVATSPRFGEIALAVLKRPFDQKGTQIHVGDIRGEVVGLPFSSNSS